MFRTLRLLGMMGVWLTFVGCTTSRVYFEEPKGARFCIEDGEKYTIPFAVNLPQRDNPVDIHNGHDEGGRPVRMTLTDGTKLKGFIYVYKLNMDQVERLAEVTFRLTSEQIEKLKKGHAVIVWGYSAKKRPVYKINLGLDR